MREGNKIRKKEKNRKRKEDGPGEKNNAAIIETMEYSKANSRPGRKEIPRLSWKPKFSTVYTTARHYAMS
jgi:hypothetical protein